MILVNNKPLSLVCVYKTQCRAAQTIISMYIGLTLERGACKITLAGKGKCHYGMQ